MPSEIEWQIHRVATSGKYFDGLHVIQTQWSLDDLLDANMVLDLLAKMEHDAYLESR